MDKRLIDIFENKQDNYLMPFFWQQGNHTDKIPEEIETIYSSGCKAVCVESRTHPHFGEKEWFNDLRIILEESKKRDMKVWILDDDHFPTGHANGLVDKFPALKKLYLEEKHIDVVGPAKNNSILIKKFAPSDEILGAYIFNRIGELDEVSENYTDITENIKGDFLYLDIPEGYHRIFILFKTHYKANDHIDIINPKSCALMIKGVYEPHYNELSEYFGNTLEGFFSDEPGFYTDFYKNGLFTRGYYGSTVGMAGVCMPISDEAIEIMNSKSGYDVTPYLVSLWYNVGEKTAEIRHNYMNTITKLYSRHFTQQIGNWCRDHKVKYIGHIIEDNNAHSKICCSAGHYFRSQHGQDMSGMDLVFNQVMPGFPHSKIGTIGAGDGLDAEFFHYMLAKMCASDSHFDPIKKGKAMCEVFGAGGWVEGTQTQKWLIDFLLVRGINHFVPHAFTPNYPNDDCPPHFHAEGNDPQFDGFTTLMNYTNKMSHLLSGGTHIAHALVMYNADGEWGANDNFMYSQKICRQLYDNHIDFDVISLDYLKNGSVFENKFRLNREVYNVLFVPYTEYLSEKNLSILKNLDTVGFDVVFVDGLPDNCSHKFKVIHLEECNKYYEKSYIPDIVVKGDAKLMRHYHVKRGATDIYMFFNESAVDTVNATVGVSKADTYLKLDMLNDNNSVGICENGEISFTLQPYQSVVYVFDKFDDEFLSQFSAEKTYELDRDLRLPYDISISNNKEFTEYEELMVSDRLPNITGPDILPEFSGKIKYWGRFYLEEPGKYAIDLGYASQNARLSINGHDVGIRICKPFIFDISKYTVAGENTIEIIVSNTLVHKLKDRFSAFTQIPPSGLMGPVDLLKIK